MNLTEGDDSLLQFLLITSHAKLACTWMCTLLLHRELRDYSLGQIAFAVFQVLFAITQLLCRNDVLYYIMNFEIIALDK